MIDVMATQSNYTQAELKIRLKPEYDDLKKKLNQQTNQCKQVMKWKDNRLEIPIFSDRIKRGKRQIKEPICFEDCQHLIIDLYDILSSQDQEACQQCKKKPTKQNIKRETFYKNLVTKINEKAFYCSFYAGRVFHKYSKKYQILSFKLLSESMNEKCLEEIIYNTDQEKLQKHIQNVISRLLRHQARNLRQIIKLPLHCLINAQKIIIPIMFDGCEHLECYEYTNILKLIYDNNNQKPIFKKKIVKCFHQDCENYFDLDLQKLVLSRKILFPAELSESISKEYSFALNVSWNYQQNKFVYDKKSIMDQEIFEIIKQQLLKDTLHFKIFPMLQYIVNKEIPEDLENKYKFSSYQINLKNILYPVRCQYCPMNTCYDLFDFISYFLQSQQMKIYCLACQHNLDPNKLESQIYFDKYLSSEIQKKKNLGNFFYNENHLAFKTHFMQNQTLSFEKMIQIYKMDRINPYQRPECSIINRRLVYPIVLPECKNKRAFEFEIFFTYMIQKDYSLSSFHLNYKCNCEFCSQIESFKLHQFYIDPTFQKILEWFPKCWEENVKTILNSFDQEGYQLKKPNIIKLDSSILPEEQQQQQNNFQNQHQYHHSNSTSNLQFNQFNRNSLQQIKPQNQQTHQYESNFQSQSHRYSEPSSNRYQNQYQPLQNNFMVQQQNQQNQFENNQQQLQPPVDNEMYFINGELVPSSLYRSRQFHQ